MGLVVGPSVLQSQKKIHFQRMHLVMSKAIIQDIASMLLQIVITVTVYLNSLEYVIH